MTSQQQKQIGSLTTARRLFATSLLTVSLAAGASSASAQDAMGVPFIGKNHLSFYTTELSRDGIADKGITIFGGTYGRSFGEKTSPARVSMLLRVGARPIEGPEAGVLDATATLAATRSLPGLEALSLTASAGAGAVLWGYGPDQDGVSGEGRMSARVPLGLGAAFDLRAGAATIAPFATLQTLYSREYDFVNDERTEMDSGWSLGHMAGVNVRFKEMVLSIAEVNGERGLPRDHRVVFSAGLSW